MLTFLLVTILILAGLFFLVAKKIPDFPFSMPEKSIKIGIILLASALVVILLNASNMIFAAKEGHKYYVLAPTGSRTAISSPGLKMVFPFSTVQEWEKFIDIKGVPTDGQGNFTESIDGIEGVIPSGVKVRYIDKVNAEVYLSVRFELPVDDEAFIKMVETYRHPKNLINNTLIPTITEQLTNVTFMYSADDYVSGAATDYKQTVEDALKNGGFVVKRVEVYDTLFNEEVFIADSAVNVAKKPRGIREIRKLTKNEKVLVNGIPKRIAHEINVNKIITAQVIVSDVKLEEQFEKKLTQQRDISAEKIIEIQKVETARAAQQRIVAEGERDKAEERAIQERQQVNVLIAEETKVKQQESLRQLAEIEVQTAKLESEALLTRERAKAEADRLKVSAGLSPQDRAEIDKETAIAVAAEFAKMVGPQIVIIGEGGRGNDLTNSLIQAEMAKKLLNKQ